MPNDDLNIRRTLEKSFDRIQLRREEQYSQYYQKETEITGLEIINLLFVGTEDEVKESQHGTSNFYEKDDTPLPETISEVKNNIRIWIISWVHSGDLIPLNGDVDRDFDSCIFPPKDLFYYIGEKGVLDTLRENKLVVDDGLEKLTKAFPKPKATTKPQEPIAPTPPEPETPPAGKDDGRGAKRKQDWVALRELTVSIWEASGRTLKHAEIYDHADYQEALSKGKTVTREYVIKHQIRPAINEKREVKVKTKNPSKPTNKRKLSLKRVGDNIKMTKGRK